MGWPGSDGAWPRRATPLAPPPPRLSGAATHAASASTARGVGPGAWCGTGRGSRRAIAWRGSNLGPPPALRPASQPACADAPRDATAMQPHRRYTPPPPPQRHRAVAHHPSGERPDRLSGPNKPILERPTQARGLALRSADVEHPHAWLPPGGRQAVAALGRLAAARAASRRRGLASAGAVVLRTRLDPSQGKPRRLRLGAAARELAACPRWRALSERRAGLPRAAMPRHARTG